MKHLLNNSRRGALVALCVFMPCCWAASERATELDGRLLAAYAVLQDQQRGDHDSALSALRELATLNNATAASMLGFAYYRGLGVSRNISESIKWWRQAAAHGDDEAAYNAGLLLLRTTQTAEALTLLEQAATGGDALACFVLGTQLAELKQIEAAERWLKQAAAMGYAPAQYNLAVVLNAEDTGDDASERANAWLTAAAPTFLPAAELLARRKNETKTTDTPNATRAHGTVHDIAWVLHQAPERYTIQVAAGRTAAAIKDLLERHGSDDPTAWFMHRPRSKEPFSAVIGSYTAYKDAELALQKLTPRLRNNAPWIRRFGVLHDELARVERGGLASERDDVQAGR